jgi:predicted molibdopterin-dependent oxidoreductase YjgC
MILRNIPDNTENKTQLLCENGRFGFNDFRRRENLRIVKAEIKNPEVNLTAAKVNAENVSLSIENAQTGNADLDYAKDYATQKMAEIIAKYGAEAAAVTVSGKATNEEILYAKNYAENLGVKIYSFDRKESALIAVTGKDASNRTFNDLLSADIILLAAPDIMKTHPVAGIQIRKAVQNGAELILIAGSKPGLADEWSNKRFSFDEAEEAVKIFETAKTEKSTVVFAQDGLAFETQMLLANAAVSGKHNGGSVCGIIQLKKNANDQGLADAGIGYAAEVTQKIKSGEIRALTAFGEGLSGAELPGESFGGVECAGLEFLCVGAAYKTAGFKTADVVLPCAGFARQSGTYTNTAGETQKVNSAF